MGEPRPVDRKATRVVGLAARTTNGAESDPATARIPGLWKSVLSGAVALGIPGRVEPSVLLAVYTDYESDHRGAYRIVVGAELDRDAIAPPGLTEVTVPVTRCLLFEARGPMPQALIEAWGRIWRHFEGQTALARSYTTDLEVHRGPEAADIYVAVR